MVNSRDGLRFFVWEWRSVTLESAGETLRETSTFTVARTGESKGGGGMGECTPNHGE